MARFNMQPISPPSTKAIAKYMLLPGIFPRLKKIGHIFSRIFFIFIRIFGLVGLIDANHPCLKTENIGRYSFAEVLILAWRNVRFDRAHVLQTTMFFSVISAVLLLAAILLAASGYMFAEYTTVVHAQYFSTPTATTEIPYKPENDWAFVFLERVFGGKEKTGVDFWITGDTIKAANPWYTDILIAMLKTYSQALLWIATFMILYLLLSAVVSAARSGKPFGEKFDSVWAPIRFCFAIGLLLPISGSGYNGAQMLAFQSAEWGSNMATNLWHKAVSAKGDKNKIIAATVADPGYRFVRDMFLINLCITSYNQLRQEKEIKDGSEAIPWVNTPTEEGNTLIYNFGNKDAPDFCGSITIPNADEYNDVPHAYTSVSGQTFLPNLIAEHYSESMLLFRPDLENNMMRDTANSMAKDFYCHRDKSLADVMCQDGTFNCTLNVEKWIDAYWKEALGRGPTDGRFFAAYDSSVEAYNAWLYKEIQSDAQYGWASAGSFYLRMSYALSKMQDILSNAPHATKLPVNLSKRFSLPKDEVSNQAGEIICGKGNDTADKCSEYAGALLLSDLLTKAEEWFAKAPLRMHKLDPTSRFYAKVNPSQWDAAMKRPATESSDAISKDGVMGFITGPLLEMIKLDAGGLDPLGQVIGWGNKMIITAQGMFVTAFIMSMIKFGLFKAFAEAVAAMLIFTAKILMVPGFFLMFVIPMLPFMYFTFAVIEWVVSIIEAAIGLPLWAMTFITGEGNLMDEAMDGVKMMFEIVLRPTIIVISLLAAIIIFTASTAYFNEAFSSYVSVAGNGSGVSSWGPSLLGGLGMIIIYMIAVYAMATSSFKLIEAIPNKFGRWMGLGGGFGSMIKMGSVGGEAGLAATAFIANEGIGIMNKATALAMKPRENKNKEEELTKKYEKWRQDEILRVDVYNNEATSFNSTLAGYNAFRATQNLPPLEERQLRHYPPEIDSGQFKDHIRLSRIAGLKDAPKIYGDLYSAPGPGAPPVGGGNGSNTNPPPGNPPPVNPPPVAPQQPTPTQQQQANAGGGNTTTKSGGGSGGTNAPAGTGFGPKPGGGAYSVSEVKAALTTLGLNMNSTPQEIEKAMQKIRGGEFTKGLSTSKGKKSASDILNGTKGRIRDAEAAYETLQRALRFGKFTNS